MGMHSLGKVAPSSTTTGQRATTNRTDPTLPYLVQAAGFQALGTNTGVVYICDTASPNLSTGAGICWEIPTPTSTTVRPAFVVGNPAGPNPLNMAEIYILPTVSGEGVRVVALRT